jgi:hypothetical protein
MKLRTPLLGMLIVLGGFSVGCVIKEAPPANQPAAAPATAAPAPAPATAATPTATATATPTATAPVEDTNAEIPADAEDPTPSTASIPAQDTWVDPPNTPGLAENTTAGMAEGRPKGLAAGAPAAFWIWRNAAGIWKVRTTTAGKLLAFTGRAKGVQAPIGRVKPSRTEFGDRLKRGTGGEVVFRFMSKGAIDGFDFRAPAKACVRFDLQLDGGKVVHVGKEAASPKGNHFVLCPPQ